ncbi:hypothetical protein BDV18DRAFT_157732 [Aspergillus unguis]
MAYRDDPEQRNANEQTCLPSDDNPPVGLDKTTSYASGWAAFGLAWTLLGVQGFIRWFASPDFRPAPLMDGPDKLATWRLVMLRLIEALSFTVLIGFVWFCVIAPYEHPGLGLTASVDEASYLSTGMWTRFLPFHRDGGPHQYAESLIWGPPMYVYFCAGVAIVSCRCLKPLRRRWPKISNVNLLIVTWCAEFLFDFVVENTIIRLSHAYGFPKTYAPLTLFAGQTEQFPLYESVLVATLGSFYTQLRLRAMDDQLGLSPVERGFDKWPAALQGPVRAFAVIGFCALSTVFIYHLPLNYLGVIGTSRGNIPSYWIPGV